MVEKPVIRLVDLNLKGKPKEIKAEVIHETVFNNINRAEPLNIEAIVKAAMESAEIGQSNRDFMKACYFLDEKFANDNLWHIREYYLKLKDYKTYFQLKELYRLSFNKDYRPKRPKEEA